MCDQAYGEKFDVLIPGDCHLVAKAREARQADYGILELFRYNLFPNTGGNAEADRVDVVAHLANFPRNPFFKEVFMTYRKRKGHDTWHWCSNCSNWPTHDYVERPDKPQSGGLCNECKAKEVVATRLFLGLAPYRRG